MARCADMVTLTKMVTPRIFKLKLWYQSGCDHHLTYYFLSMCYFNYCLHYIQHYLNCEWGLALALFKKRLNGFFVFVQSSDNHHFMSSLTKCIWQHNRLFFNLHNNFFTFSHYWVSDSAFRILLLGKSEDKKTKLGNVIISHKGKSFQKHSSVDKCPVTCGEHMV